MAFSENELYIKSYLENYKMKEQDIMELEDKYNTLIQNSQISISSYGENTGGARDFRNNKVESYLIREENLRNKLKHLKSEKDKIDMIIENELTDYEKRIVQYILSGIIKITVIAGIEHKQRTGIRKIRDRAIKKITKTYFFEKNDTKSS